MADAQHSKCCTFGCLGSNPGGAIGVKMNWREACKLSQKNRAQRGDLDEIWTIIDPDTKAIEYDISGYAALRIGEVASAVTEVNKFVAGPQGIIVEQIKVIGIKEMDKYEDWEPITPKILIKEQINV